MNTPPVSVPVSEHDRYVLERLLATRLTPISPLRTVEQYLEWLINVHVSVIEERHPELGKREVQP